MLVVTFHNDGTGDERIGNYNITVLVNGVPIYTSRIEGHERDEGWEGLVKRFAEKLRPGGYAV